MYQLAGSINTYRQQQLLHLLCSGAAGKRHCDLQSVHADSAITPLSGRPEGLSSTWIHEEFSSKEGVILATSSKGGHRLGT